MAAGRWIVALEQFSNRDVRESAFDLELEFAVPEAFWEKESEPEPPPYRDPAQRYFWKGSVPKPPKEPDAPWQDRWLESFHHALISRGWPRETIDAVYSYFEGPVENPDRDEEPNTERAPAMSFRVWIPGDWLASHPEFLKDLPNLAKRGLGVRTGERIRMFPLHYWRLTGQQGPLRDVELEQAVFDVAAPRRREAPAAYRKGPKEWFPEP